MNELKSISLTDKSRKMNNILTFYVHPSKNKFQIKNYISKLIKLMMISEKEKEIKIERINTINCKKRLKKSVIARKKGLKFGKKIKKKKVFVKFSRNLNLESNFNLGDKEEIKDTIK